MNLFSELKRRNVLRVVAAYVAVSWLLIQVVETLFPVFGLSDAAIRVVVIALAVGFIPTIAIAWAFDLTPDGLVRDSEVDHESAATKAGSKRLDRFVMVALALAVGFFAFDKFLLDPARDREIAEAAKEEGRAEAAQESQDSGRPVLAVLPFTAVTDSEDSNFFAAGVHDDLLTKLAKLPSMLVISRTSVLEYKDVQRNMREIGTALGADAILEGGVQSAGDRIRINVQLIDAQTDENLWAETYDRELTTSNIFDVQDEIARSIAEALHVSLGTPTKENLIPTSNMAAYRAYHQAMSLRDITHGFTTSAEYRELLRKAVELDPNFTRPRAMLVGSYALDAFGSQDPETIREAETILASLQATAPDSADFLFAQTFYTYYVLRDYALALQIADQALKMAPSDTQLIAVTAWIKRRQANHAGYLESMRRARQLEPGNSDWTSGIIRQLVVMHQYDEAMAEIESFDGRDYSIEKSRATLKVRDDGDLQRLAADVVRIGNEFENRSFIWDNWQAHFDARDFAGAEKALEDIPGRAEGKGTGISASQAMAIETYWALGDAEKLAEHVADGRRTMEKNARKDDYPRPREDLSAALLDAAEGNREAAVQNIQNWYRSSRSDLTERAIMWDLACRVLGIAGAADAAVDCIRKGLSMPSSVMPFIEPHLPYYDTIRDEPVFVELLEELG